MANSRAVSLDQELDWHSLAPPWLREIRRAAEALALGADTAVLESSRGGADVLTSVRALGGTFRPVEPLFSWVLHPEPSLSFPEYRRVLEDFEVEDAGILDFHGLVEIEVSGRKYLAGRLETPSGRSGIERVTVLAGAPLKDLMDLESRM